MSSGVTSLGPSGNEIGRSERSEVIPRARAVSATLEMPTIWPSRRKAQFEERKVWDRMVDTEPPLPPKLLAR